MAKNTDNGMLWALGAVGALALGAAVASRAASGSSSRMGSSAKGTHTCVTCGRGVHLVSGSRAIKEQVEEQVEEQGIVSSRGSFLLRNRADAKNGFSLPLTDCYALEAYFNRPVDGFKVVHTKEMESLLNREGQEDAARVLLEQSNTLYVTYGVGKLVDAEAKKDPPTLSPPMDAFEYADEKARDRMRRVLRKIKAGTGFPTGTLGLKLITEEMGGKKTLLRGSADRATPKRRAPMKDSSSAEAALFDLFVRHYLVELYLNRAWTLYILGGGRGADRARADKLTRDERRAVYLRKNEIALRLFDGITFELPEIETCPLTDRQEASRAARRKKEAEEEQEELPPEIAQDVIVNGSGIPELLMYAKGVPCAVFFISEGGTQYFRYGKQRITLITKTSKMSSPSFGLPAGKVGAEGGTCPGRAISQTFRRIREQKGKPVSQQLEAICDVCYAMGANYGYANNMIDQEGRASWIKNLLKGKDAVKSTADALTQMVSDYAIYGAHGGRDGQEIGVWRSDARDGTKKGAITYRSGTKRPVCRNTDLRIKIPGMEAAATTRDFFRMSGVKNGQVCGFFRIHDSGDFGLGVNYLKAWGEVFKSLPHVRFWAPVRVWAAFTDHPTSEQRAWNKRFMSRPSLAVIQQQARNHKIVFRKPGSGNRYGSRSLEAGLEEPSPAPSLSSPGELGAFVKVETSNDIVVRNEDLLRTVVKMAAPDNAAIRPSDLYIHAADGSGSNIPYIEGLAAGSGVAKSAGEGEYPRVYDMRGREAYQCPVYTKEKQINPDGTVSYREAKSCQAANCRACWLATDLPIFYGAH
jgi:hypothetical protein